jgi:hypothetical protein
MEEFARYTFHAKQDGSGNPFIAVVPNEQELTVLKGGVLAFTLPAGTTGEEAIRLADYLDEVIDKFTYFRDDE